MMASLNCSAERERERVVANEPTECAYLRLPSGGVAYGTPRNASTGGVERATMPRSAPYLVRTVLRLYLMLGAAFGPLPPVLNAGDDCDDDCDCDDEDDDEDEADDDADADADAESGATSSTSSSSNTATAVVDIIDADVMPSG